MSSPPGASWPDWRGETAVIVATGPSASQAPLHMAKGLARFIVIKASWRLAPFADVLYGCDRDWWIENLAVPEFKGLKVSASPTIGKVFPGVKVVDLVTRARIETGEVGRVGCGLRTGGGHSGFQAINLAVQFGATRVVLVGFDMSFERGAHWHDPSNVRNAFRNEKLIEECRVALDSCAPQFVELGVQVVNASMNSALQNYPKAELLDAIAG